MSVLLSHDARREEVTEGYCIAAIDVHKRMLTVVITDASLAKAGEMTFQRRRFGTLRSQLEELSDWLKA